MEVRGIPRGTAVPLAGVAFYLFLPFQFRLDFDLLGQRLFLPREDNGPTF
jgi:hypothetical protein